MKHSFLPVGRSLPPSLKLWRSRGVGLKSFFVLFLINFFITSNLFSTPISNRYDPNAFHTVFGSDKFYTKKESWLSLSLSPFYQHASGAKNKDGKKVPEGDILGRWNMLGLFFGSDAAPENKPFGFLPATDANPGQPDPDSVKTNYKYLSRARRILDGLNERGGDVEWYPGGGNLPVNPAIGADSPDIDKNYADEVVFDNINNKDGFFSVPIDYEKYGLRGKLNVEFGHGIGLQFKSGIVEYKQKPTFNDQTQESGDDTNVKRARKYMKEYLMNEQSKKEIAKELNLNIDEEKEVALEDTHIQFYWNYSFDLKNEEDEHVVSMIPYIAFGVWVPSGEEKDQNKAFSLPTGNDGYVGVTLEGSVNLDFPGMVQLGFGGGAAFFGSKNYSNYRVPNSIHQSGIYPWPAKIKRNMGTVWYVNASFMAKDFIENLSLYFDYIHTQHEEDSIFMKEATNERNALFKPKKLEEESKWKGDFVHAGLNYRITPGLELGLSFNAHITGVRVYRTTTILGSITFNY
jgi:hypothetical protein